jgi:hypothetical protein
VTAADGTEDARFPGNTFSPNEQGHAVIAREFVRTIRAALAARATSR